jgi:hypothetical protein
MLFVSAAEDPANPVGKLVSAQQPLGLNYLAFAVDPLGLYCVEPGALDGQQTWNYPDPTVAGFDPAVMDDDPLSYLMALVPTSVVPDKKQSLLTPLLELLAAPPEEPCGYGAHRPTVYESQPGLFQLGHIKPIAGESLRLGIVLSRLFLKEMHRLFGICPRTQARSLEAGEPSLVLKSHSPLRMSFGETDQPVSSPYLKRPRASNVSAVCISASDVSLADRVRLHTVFAGQRRPVVVRASEALN